MKGMGMESDAASVNYELQRLRRSVRTAKLLTLLLAFIVLALFIAIAAVGVSQAKKISNLNSLAHAQSVILGSGQSSLRNKADVTYGGSLFRGSGFWATKLPLPGNCIAYSSPLSSLVSLYISFSVVLVLNSLIDHVIINYSRGG